MSSFRRIWNKSTTIANGKRYEQAVSITNLERATGFVYRVIFVHEQKVMIAVSWNGNARVYDIESEGVARGSFDNHMNKEIDIVQVAHDLVVSVDVGGMLYAWKPSTATQVG